MATNAEVSRRESEREQRTETSLTGSEKCYTADQKKITKTKEELKLTSLGYRSQLKLTIHKKLEAEVYLKPQIIREGQSCSLEVRLEVQVKGKLHFQTIINKSKHCHIVVVTTVTENKTGLILAQYTNKEPFSMPEDGYANYEWKLISNDDLKKCSTDKVDIRIELLLYVQDWNEYESQVIEDEYVLINKS